MADLASAFSKILEIIKILEKMRDISRFRLELNPRSHRYIRYLLCVLCVLYAKPIFSRKHSQDRKEDANNRC